MIPTKEGELGPRRSALGVKGEVSGHPQQMTKQKTSSLLYRWECWDSRRRRVSFLPAFKSGLFCPLRSMQCCLRLTRTHTPSCLPPRLLSPTSPQAALPWGIPRSTAWTIEPQSFSLSCRGQVPSQRPCLISPGFPHHPQSSPPTHSSHDPSCSHPQTPGSLQMLVHCL